MGGSTSSTPGQANNPVLPQTLPGQFLGHSGYQQPNQVAPITQPTLQTPILPTPDQTAAATKASILARNPMPAPRAAPRMGNQQPTRDYNMTGRGNR